MVNVPVCERLFHMGLFLAVLSKADSLPSATMRQDFDLDLEI